MQQTRQAILEFLKENGAATVDELAGVVGLNSVTVRHHLDILRGDELIGDPVVRHRSKPGRPQFVYTLTEKASTHFPKNYCDLAAKLLEEVKATTPPDGVKVILEGVANRLSAAAPKLAGDEPTTERLDRAVIFLNDHGYVAGWEQSGEGYLLHTCNCPYEALAKQNPELCSMDLTLAGNLLGGTVERVSWVLDGASSCSYRFGVGPIEPRSGHDPAKLDRRSSIVVALGAHESPAASLAQAEPELSRAKSS
jgi:predicted ArsR family transcriptional regulator